MVWFGVLLCVNMQTAFMHPPFGFALFYLRGIRRRKSIRTSQDLLGRDPVAGDAADPRGGRHQRGRSKATYWISAGSTVDPSTIELNILQMEPLSAFDMGPPGF